MAIEMMTLIVRLGLTVLHYSHINLRHVIASPTPSLRSLGALLDSKLNFRAHRKATKTKMVEQLNTLYRTTAFTWGATLLKVVGGVMDR